MLKKLLVANRGEIALRIHRAALDLGLDTVAVYSPDDRDAPHARCGGQAVALQPIGAAAYLDIDALLAAARHTGCDAVHPGYGFLSERANFAQTCADAGLVFVGPAPAQLALFGDKARARALAAERGLALLPGTEAATLVELQHFFADQRRHDPASALMLKAVAGGGGRGMRVVADPDALAPAFEACAAEARAAFGSGAVYAELLMPRARHVEVQLIGDGDRLMALGERECTLQRRFQKVVETAPCPGLDADQRARLVGDALRLVQGSGFAGLVTVEFLVDALRPGQPFVFIEANPRLQVEHTVTEAVTGLDLVQLQLGIAGGQSLAALGLDPAAPPVPNGVAVQWRICAETLDGAGRVRPSAGRISRCELPGGPGVRVDGAAVHGLAPSPHHDTLLAKLVVHLPGATSTAAWEPLLRRSRRALAECRIDGLATNLGLLRALAAWPALLGPALHTRWLEQQLPDLLRRAAGLEDAPPAAGDPGDGADRAGRGESADEDPGAPADPPPEGLLALCAPMAGRLLRHCVAPGDLLAAGADALLIEAMKMQHGVALPQAARVVSQRVAEGGFVRQGQVLLWLAAADHDEGGATAVPAADHDPHRIRPDLQRLVERLALTRDDARPEAIARRHAAGGRSARENIADLCDPGSFSEYGALAIAAQTRRRSVDDLQRNTPADGLVCGTASVNAAAFGAQRGRCAVLAYDYTVLAGTQGWRNHHKKDRLLALALRQALPTVLFAEGGGGRPGDVDMPVIAGLNNHTFSQFAALSGRVPVVGIVHGRCFAGNAALLGCADVVIATRSANIGMGGPAMIEGGGLGVFRPEQIGPAADLQRCGVVDLLVDDEAAAVAAARQYLSYFQGLPGHAGPPPVWSAADPAALRHAVPQDRQRAYDMRALLHRLADSGSLLELRAGFGAGIVTALARIEGRPLALMANNPQHLGGAIDPDAADKAARFMQLCNAHGLPLLSLCDTPGFMVGPEVERRAQVRHACRMFVNAAQLTVPCFTVVVRKGYGLGAQAMALGGFDAPMFTVAWPTAEFGAMGLEGAVRLGYRKELQAAADGPEREALYLRLVDRQYEAGSAINMAQTLEIDAVIDPADTRRWLLRGLDSAAPWTGGPSRRFIDGW